MSYYLNSDSLLWPTRAGTYDVRSSLPAGTYAVGLHPQRGFFLKPIADFDITGKVYGNTTRHADRILSTFKARPATTGVMLTGEKGSGKTMLTKMISQKAKLEGISTLVINTPFHGDDFNQFVQSIDEPCIILFDEFEKVFDDEAQEATLTLLDGVYPSKKLFLLTANDKYRVNQHMRNRPGRIFYMIEYGGLTAEFIEEYCNDNLINKSYIPQVCRLTLIFEKFNFDMLKAVVEEMNRYNESPQQALELLNTKPQSNDGSNHDVNVYVDGVKMDKSNIYPDRVRGNPVAVESMEFHVTVPLLQDPNREIDPDSEDEAGHKTLEMTLTQNDLRKIDPEAGTFTYVVGEGTPDMAVIVISRQQHKPSYNWLDAL